MDPTTSAISVIVAALASGATIAFKTTVEQSVKDAYAALKERIRRKYVSLPSLEALEKEPESESTRRSLTESLSEAKAETDTETVEQARDLLDALMPHVSEIHEAIGIDLKNVQAEYLKVKDIVAKGERTTVAIVRESNFRGGIEFEGVRSEAGEDTSSKKP